MSMGSRWTTTALRVLSDAVERPTFTYRGQRFLWGYSADRQICAIWPVGDSSGRPHLTWPISEHEAAWRVFRSLEPCAESYAEPVAQNPSSQAVQTPLWEETDSSGPAEAEGCSSHRFRRQSILDSLRTVEFRQTLRGYDMDDVDDYLGRIATEVEALQERLRQSSDRQQHADERVA